MFVWVVQQLEHSGESTATKASEGEAGGDAQGTAQEDARRITVGDE
jgi:hypothetical protein